MSRKQEESEIISQKFGRLTPIKEAELHIQPNGNKVRRFICKCDCGTIKSIYLNFLKSGHTRSCGCISKETIPNNKIQLDKIIGVKINKLTPIKEIESKRIKCGDKVRIFLCLCDCGNTTELSLSSIKSGKTKSCGCYRYDNSYKTHGMIKTSEYKSWGSLKDRCTNPNNKSYKDYGGRGIKVCDRWLESFENFIEDMGLKPTSKHSIDRKDVNGNYTKENCKWATKIEQMNNTRRNVFYDFNGVQNTLSTIAKTYSVSYHKLWNNVVKQKMSIDDALLKLA